MRIGCLQFNPVLGDVVGNMERADALLLESSEKESLDLLVLPEMAFSGRSHDSLASEGSGREGSSSMLGCQSKRVCCSSKGLGRLDGSSLRSQVYGNSDIVRLQSSFARSYHSIFRAHQVRAFDVMGATN